MTRSEPVDARAVQRPATPAVPAADVPPPDSQIMRVEIGGRTVWQAIGAILLTLVLVFVVFLAGIWVYLEFSIKRVDALADYSGRPVAASGTNWLIVGSDSREGLSDQEIKDLRLGKVEGRRTDTIILLHKPASGKPTLVSLPRDS